LEPTSSDTFDIELVALHLTSVDPLDLTPLGGPFIGVFADLHATIDQTGLFGLPTSLQPSIGLMNVSHTFPNGGHFDACWGNVVQCAGLNLAGLGQPGGGIFAQATFTVLGGNIFDPLDHILNVAVPSINLAQLNAPWLHLPPPNYPVNASFPAGSFYPGVLDTPTPSRVALPHQGPHPVILATPEPGSAVLMGGGLLALLALARRASRRA
jgi:hypothetical protein